MEDYIPLTCQLTIWKPYTPQCVKMLLYITWPIGNNFVFGSSAWIPLPRKCHWKGKVTRGWYSTWVKTKKFANYRFTEANFTSYFAILWFALGYAKICALWVSLNWPLVINKSYVSTQRTIDQSNKTAILIQIWAFLVSIFLAKVSKYF